MSDLARFLQEALRAEREGRDSYLQAAERVDDPHLSAILRALARDEEEHERMILLFYQALSRHQEWPTELRAPTEQTAPTVPGVSEAAADNIDSDSTFLDIYEAARAAEIQARDSYLERAASASSEREAKFFEFLANTEAAHVDALDALLHASRRDARPGDDS